MKRNELSGGSFHQFDVRGGPSYIDGQVAADSPARLLQALKKCGEAALAFRVVRSQVHQHANATHALASLRMSRQWPCCRRAAE
ncbi:hypothetical protein [Bradyrhizobium sp.]|uniref:hypothetical protein n=1 Tax=Bradyrhizobium sp. TaxID=376 RepID=UPI002D49F1BA|nr:hypothetical protein [Bradyrhizobium sp.]HZR75994.1 hypothetical protein [Bradyrhizobium sp.]